MTREQKPGPAPTTPSSLRRHMVPSKRGIDLSQEGMTMYMDRMGDIPLLSKAEEAQLGALVSAGLDAKREMATANSLRQRSLSRTIKAGDDAANKFVNANLRLVLSIAKKYTWSKVPLEDLVQEGNLGLMHAVQKFDYTKGFKFSTYAMWWIRQSIGRGLDSYGWSGKRLPDHVAQDIYRMVRTENELQTEFGREPTTAELATDLDVDEATVTQWKIWNQESVSLDQARGNDQGSTNTWKLIDYVPDNAPTAFDLISSKISQQEIRKLLDVLTNDERTYIIMRFLDQPPKTTQEISEALETRPCKECGTRFIPSLRLKEVFCSDCQPKLPLRPGDKPLTCQTCGAEFIPSTRLKRYCSVKCQSASPYYHPHNQHKLRFLEHSALQKMQATLAKRFIDTGDVFLSG